MIMINMFKNIYKIVKNLHFYEIYYDSSWLDRRFVQLIISCKHTRFQSLGHNFFS